MLQAFSRGFSSVLHLMKRSLLELGRMKYISGTMPLSEIYQWHDAIETGSYAGSCRSTYHSPSEMDDEQIVENNIAQQVGNGQIETELGFLGRYQQALESIAHNHDGQEHKESTSVGYAIFQDFRSGSD